jgi:hypothetical protein
MQIDLTRPTNAEDFYGQVFGVSDVYGNSKGFEIMATDCAIRTDLAGVNEWRRHVRHWHQLSNGNKLAQLPSLKTWALNNPELAVIIREY